MINYITRTSKGNYNINVETDNYKYYRVIEEFVRMFIDHKLDFINNEANDGEPVKHGRWSEQAIRPKNRKVDEIGYYCSECGYFESYTAKYCAGCGAKMEGGPDNAE